MSFFAPRSSIYEPNYAGLFRLIDEFNNYANEVAGNNDSTSTEVAPSSSARNLSANGNAANANKSRAAHSNMTFWTPKFDLQETPNTYILHGEFPGLDKKDINIEFTDEQTLTIRGHSERSRTHTSEDDAAASGAGEQGKEVAKSDKDKHSQQQPKIKYWVSERSFGEFARAFTFPTRVDSSGVVAKLDNGVLNLIVPKAAKPQGKKITVE